MIVSVLVFSVGLVLSCAVVLLLRRTDPAFVRPIRQWFWYTSVLWVVLCLFVVAVTLPELGPKALLIGTGMSLIGWATTTLGLIWTNKVNQVVRTELDRQLSSDQKMADRFYSNRWISWLMPKRKG